MKQKLIQNTIFWLTIFLLTPIIVTFTITNPTTTLIYTTIIILSLLTYKNTKTGLKIIILLPIIGELLRIQTPIGSLILTDIAIPIYILITIIKYLNTPEKTNFKKPLSLPIILFILTAILSLIQALTFLTTTEVLKSSMYLIRYTQYALLYFTTIATIKTQKDKTQIINTITISAVLLSIAGFIQLKIYPNITPLEKYGWDPHIGRLVSTWLDPNFVGGFLSLITILLISTFLYTKQKNKKLILLATILLLTTAIFLTYSRSAYLTLLTGIFIISILKSKKLVIIGLIIITLGLGISSRARERVAELTTSITSVIGLTTTQNPDPTARLRIKSWTQTINTIKKYPALGVGYNTLKYINQKEGYTKSTKIHSASGSDSSLLTILATTGIIGFIPFIAIYLIAFITAYKKWKTTKNKQQKGISLGIIGPIMLLFWIITALNHTTTSQQNNQSQ